MAIHNKILGLGLTSAVLLAGCGGGSGTSTGEMTLRVTDAPVDEATAVVVEFTGVQLRQDDIGAPEIITFDTPRQIDLLLLTGGANEILLDGIELPAGRYDQLRLLVNADDQDASGSHIMIGDVPYPLHVPSGELKLVSGFTVPAGGSADFTIDFDLRKAVTKPVGQEVYFLRPALRLVETAQAGSVSGTVGNELVVDGCSPAVYVFSGAGVSPDDVGSAEEPLSSALVELDDASGTYGYTAAFLPPGDYTVAFTCDAASDDPEADDELTFVDPTDATVTAGEETNLNFGAVE